MIISKWIALAGLLVLMFGETAHAASASGAEQRARLVSRANASPLPLEAMPAPEHIRTPRYRIDIVYPVLPVREARLAKHLKQIAEASKQDFLQALPDPKTFPELANRQLQLRIDFKLVARTSEFVSVRETGFQDTGGAHPVPIDAAIVYGTQEHRTLSLDDLFTNPEAARKVIADSARAELMKKIVAQAPKAGEGSPEAIKEWKINAKQMIEQGTQPTPQNFANYIVRAGGNAEETSPGLTLIFPPYQVAAYVYGTQTVDVPARAFASDLKRQYRDAFTTAAD